MCPDKLRQLVKGRGLGESAQDLLRDGCPHLVPLALHRKRVQALAEVTPPMDVEDLVIAPRGSVVGNRLT